MDGINGIRINDIAISVEALPKHRLPALCVRIATEPTVYKVATFDSKEKAEWFKQIMWEFVQGFGNKTGKWIQIAEHNYGYTAEYDYKCNLCNFRISFTDRSPIQERYYYCPNCGARMVDDDSTQTETP